MSRNIKKSQKKAYIIITLVLIGASSVAVWQIREVRFNGKSVTSDTGTVGKIDLSPPTKEDKVAVDEHKETLPDNSPSPATPPPTNTKKSVKPIIVEASSDGIRSFIPGIFEAGGICKAVFSKGSNSFSKEVSGTQDATTTRCANIDLAPSDFLDKGSWSVVIQYNSQTSAGSSDASTFEVK